MLTLFLISSKVEIRPHNCQEKCRVSSSLHVSIQTALFTSWVGVHFEAALMLKGLRSGHRRAAPSSSSPETRDLHADGFAGEPVLGLSSPHNLGVGVSED